MEKLPFDRISAEADFSQITGVFNKAQHSTNSAPNLSNRGIRDFTENFKRMNFEYSRTHDWALWNAGQRVIDTHFVFPLMHLDPADPKNYYFDPSDEMIRKTQEAGCKVFYRLGTSIEHSGLRPEQKHFNSLPPEDYEKYAEVLAGIIRHYTKGWANGFHYDMQYWEIWNEAENDPTCWKGSYEEFIKFFVVVLKRLKAEYPKLKIGGPAATGYRIDLIEPLLKACKEAGVAPDFISWHSYCCNPDSLIGQPGRMKEFLKDQGFPNCELAVTEWHYLVSWDGIQRNMSEENRRIALESQGGLSGIDSAVYNLSVLCGWQNTCLDMGFYYGANPVGDFGYLNSFGGFNKNFYSMCMFGTLLGTFEQKINSRSLDEAVYLQGGVADDGTTGMLLVTDYRSNATSRQVKVNGMDGAFVTAILLDHTHNMTACDVTFRNGILTLLKTTVGSAAYLVKFDKR